MARILRPLSKINIINCDTLKTAKLFNSFPNNKILHQSKFKTFADKKKKMQIKTWNLFWEGYKTLWEKEKKDGFQHFLFFPQCFQKVFSTMLLKLEIMW